MSFDHSNAGSGFLGVDVVSGQSAATSVWATSPLKILTPRPRGPSVWACLGSFGGGLVAGDEIEVTLRLGARARCFLSTQASTKVYRNPNARPCGHRLRAELGPGSLLALSPDPVQAFKGSRYCQQQEFLLAPGSSLVLVDSLSSGRAACGERWSFSRFHSRNEVFLGSKRVVLDSLLLDPQDGPLTSPFRMGRFNCLATVLLIGELLQNACSRLLEEFGSEPVVGRPQLVASASSIENGALLRLAGESVEQVASEIRRHLAVLADLLEDDPWSRKF